jgi:aldose 1-epimerase
MDHFGRTAAGEDVARVVLRSDDLTVAVLTYGAALQSVRLRGVVHDLTLGSDALADYEGMMRYHGTLVGPVANRLSGAQAVIGGVLHQLPGNEPSGALLHSGAGMQARVWTVAEAGLDAVTLALTLAGDGFPGRREVRARFAVDGAVLRLEVTAVTDAPTLMNVAQHSYWNLAGSRTWAGHGLRIAADRYLPTDAAALPTGEVAPVAGTPLDFRSARVIGPGDPVMDVNFCLSEARVPLREVLWLQGGAVAMGLATTEPGVQVYDGQQGIRPGRWPHEGLAIEAQGWPDAPNHPGFPSVALHPGETYRQITEWRFVRDTMF